MRILPAFFLLLTSAAWSQDIDPRGIYHNAFSGGFSGTEWFQVFPVAGSDRYRVADIFGGGFNATITPTGAIVLDAGAGTGSFTTPDAWTIRPTVTGVSFLFNNLRVANTDADFPLELVSASPANGILSGTYRSLTERLNPRTGALLSGGVENVTVLASGQTFRITDPGGLFFQGVFESPLEVGFRVVSPVPTDPRFRTFAGSSTNMTQNVLGRVRVESANSWSAIILLQTRAALGSQVQSLFRFTATRVDPLPTGDLTGDRTVDAADRVAMIEQLGRTSTQDGFNIAADLDGDGRVGSADLRALVDVLGLCFADLDGDGELTLFDFLAFQNGFAAGDLRADFDGDGSLTIFDFLAFQNEFAAGCP